MDHEGRGFSSLLGCVSAASRAPGHGTDGGAGAGPGGAGTSLLCALPRGSSLPSSVWLPSRPQWGCSWARPSGSNTTPRPPARLCGSAAATRRWCRCRGMSRRGAGGGSEAQPLKRLWVVPLVCCAPLPPRPLARTLPGGGPWVRAGSSRHPQPKLLRPRTRELLVFRSASSSLPTPRHPGD